MTRGLNPDFIRGGVLMLLEKNYQIYVDPQEIDTGISIGENISIILDRYKSPGINEILDEL